MAPQKREKVREKDITGLKYFDMLIPLLGPLHDVGCQRDKAGNRRLHFDEYCSLLLLYLFNPTVTSLRGLQQASELKKVQKKLGCKRASLGSLSESVAVFDPELLTLIIEELGQKLQPVKNVGRGYVKHTLTAVDGSVVKTLATITQAAYLKNCHGASKSAWRLHTHFDIDHHVPRRIDVTPGLNSGKSDEKNVLRKVLQPDHCYVMDRWYGEFLLWNDIHAIKSSYVCRVRDNSVYEVIEERPLSEEARAADIIFDGIVQFGASSKPDKRPNHPTRLIMIKTNPHTQRGKQPGGKTGPPSDGILRIVTDLVDDVPAEIIGDIFRHRWMVEIFFRFFKHILGCRHLLSQSPAGIEIQTYMAIIACMLISLWTGRKPTLRTYEMICHFFAGLADEEELLAHIAKLPPHEA
jgi:hypothetical protein